MSVLVGVDAGGSHTEAVAARHPGRPLGRYRGPRGAVQPGAIDRSAELIAAVVRAALSVAGLPPPERVVVGAAGAGREVERTALEGLLGAILGPRVTVRVTTDAMIALEAAFGTGPGVVLNAGSGSIAYGRDAAGAVWRVGGMGWQFGDDGSGYALGRDALGAVARAADGRGPATRLTERLQRELALGSIDDMIRWAQRAAAHEVAALAHAACEAAREGDPPATALVERAARDLAVHVTTLLARLPSGRQLQVAFAGGLLTPGSPVRAALERLLAAEAPNAQILPGIVDPPLGALALAARL